MKKKGFLVILIAAFVVLLAGAYALYGTLSEQVESKQLMVNASAKPQSTDIPQASDAAVPESTELPSKDEQYVYAPDFTVYDREGNEVHLHDYIGKPIVLNFWASWCGPCQMEMPDFQDKYLEIGEDVQFLMVNMTNGRETLTSATEFIDDKGYTFPVFYDTLANAAMTYGAYSLPTTYFIDAEGYVIAYAEGAIDAELLQVGLDMIYFPE